MIKIDKFKALKPSTALKKATVIISSKIHDGKSVLDDYSREVYKHLYSIGVVDPSIMDELIKRVEGGENTRQQQKLEDKINPAQLGFIPAQGGRRKGIFGHRIMISFTFWWRWEKR